MSITPFPPSDTADTAPAPTPLPYSVEADGLVKQFGSKKTLTTAVDNVSLRVREGEFFGFLGPNGAGKSTTIRMLCGLLKPTQGHVRIVGHDLATQALEVKRFIGVLPEEASLYERLSGEEFLVFAGRMYGLPREEAERRAADLLALMELTEAKNKLIVDYSMGMKKKTALASALIHRPRVLFLDEPFNGIDPVSVRAIRNALKQLTDHGTTIFFSSHVMEVVERLCTRVAIINRGRIVAEGTLDELRANQGDHADLEDIFLKLVEARNASGVEETLQWL